MVDTLNVIKLFKPTATSFENNGLGYLTNASKCEVVEERNGAFELEMEYPVDGIHFDEIKMRSIIFAKPNRYDPPQPFRVYAISKPFNGIVTINAEHISYDTSGYPIKRFSSESLDNAISNINTGTILPSGETCPFQILADFSANGDLSIDTPASMRSLIGGSDKSLISSYGGELEFDKFDIKLHLNRGSDNGVSVRYGKNLTDIRQEQNCSNVYTAVYPYYHYKYENDTTVVDDIKTLDGDGLVQVEGTFDFVRILPLDVSSEWNNSHQWTKEFPSKNEIRDIANKYIKDNNIGVPTVNITVSFELLSQTEEYKNIKLLEEVRLCDIVTVEFPKLGISTKSKCIKTTYNVLNGKYISVELGESNNSLASTIVSTNQENQKAIESKVTPNFLNLELENATRMISGNLGGYVIFHDADLDGKPDEILIMDTPDIETATNVWRWNQAGLAHSSHGYNPDIDQHPNWRYDTAITQAGKILGQFIAAHSMSADAIQGGTFVVGGLNNTDGVIRVVDKNDNTLMTINNKGITLNQDSALTIKWGQVTETNGVVTDDNKSTKIGKNFIRTLNLEVGNEISMGENATISWDKVTGTSGVITDDNKSTKIGKNFIRTLNLEVGNEISMGENATISWNKVTGTSGVASKDDIPSDDHITRITRTTVTTETLVCDNLTAGKAVDAENITGTNITGKRITGSTFQTISDDSSLATTIEGGRMATNFIVANDGSSGIWMRDGTVIVDPAFQAGSVRVLSPSTSTAGANCRLTTGDTPGLIWYASGSSIKYKHDFKSIFNEDLDPHNLYKIGVFQYKYQTNYIDNEKDIRYDTDVIGFIAENIRKYYPIAVDYYYDKKKEKEVVTDWNEKYIIPPMLKLIQEQHEEIEILKTEMNDLKKQVDKLSKLINERM